jgi:predicted O-methyltransferase YrrM
MNLLRAFSRKRPAPTAPAPDDVLQLLDEPFRAALLSMYRSEPQAGSNGQQYALDANTRISPEQGMWLHELYCARRPRASVEIGLAYGFSTMFFLAALARNGSGNHTAIDPFQGPLWHGIGLQKIEETKTEHRFRFIEDYATRAATDLARAGQTFDFVYIDGGHRFDDVMVDFALFAQLCPVEGVIVLDDMWLPSIRTAVAFIRSNRPDFKEMISPIKNVAAFQRVAPDQRNWKNFAPFNASP